LTLSDLLDRLLGINLKPKPVPPPAPTPAPVPTPGESPAKMREAHDSRRIAAGRPPFRPSVKLQAAAQGHADRMAREGQMAHSGIGDGDLGSRLRGVRYACLRGGENIAWNYPSVAELMAAWMKSPGHRDNILGDFSEAGFAVAHGADGSPYYCSVFGFPAVTASIGAAPPAYTLGSPEVTGDYRTAAASSIQVLAG
jgi:uncharacterized protein YkwD